MHLRRWVAVGVATGQLASCGFAPPAAPTPKSGPRIPINYGDPRRLAPQYAGAALWAPVYVTAQALEHEELRIQSPSGPATANAPAAGSNAPTFQPWTITPRDETVRQALLRWSLRAKWTFSTAQWLVPVDIPVHETSQVWTSSFEAAVRALSRAASTPMLAIHPCFGPGRRVWIVPKSHDCESLGMVRQPIVDSS